MRCALKYSSSLTTEVTLSRTNTLENESEEMNFGKTWKYYCLVHFNEQLRTTLNVSFIDNVFRKLFSIFMSPTRLVCIHKNAFFRGESKHSNEHFIFPLLENLYLNAKNRHLRGMVKNLPLL